MKFYTHVVGQYTSKSQRTFWKILMRIQLVISSMCFLIAQLHATDLRAQRISINTKDSELRQVLSQVRQQTSVDFIFDDAVINRYAKPVTVHADNNSVEEVLKRVFDKQPALEYIIDQNTIVIKLKKSGTPKGKISINQYEDSETLQWIVEGSVVDEITGDPLEGVTIRLQNRGITTRSDKKGNFKITVPTP